MKNYDDLLQTLWKVPRVLFVKLNIWFDFLPFSSPLSIYLESFRELCKTSEFF